MSKNLEFNKAKEKHLEKLFQFVPIVNKVHGDSHKEFNEVKSIFDEIYKKIKTSQNTTVNLNQEFSRLQAITNDYKIPSDVCESYSQVYEMLGELDKSYHKLGD